jgi:uncharacterized Zn finger protein (UPF0148 family)
MSIIYCHAHDKHYDSDYETNCPVCEEVEVNTEEENERLLRARNELGSERRNAKLL